MLSLFKYTGTETAVTIPEYVTYIYGQGTDTYGAFKKNNTIKSVSIPKGVTKIGDNAFYSCSSLEEITFSGDAPSFGSNCFVSVSATAFYPALNKTWTENNRLNYGGRLTWVAVLPPDVTFKLPASTKTVGESAFEGDTSITAVEIPNGCTSIGKWTFKDCTNLTQIRIPASVTSIDTTAFEGCTGVLIYGKAGSAAQT